MSAPLLPAADLQTHLLSAAVGRVLRGEAAGVTIRVFAARVWVYIEVHSGECLASLLPSGRGLRGVSTYALYELGLISGLVCKPGDEAL